MRCGLHWRWLRGVLAALIVMTFAASPSLDGLVCGDEALAAADAGHAHAQDAVDHDTPCEDGGHDAHGACQHGHCHHGGAFFAFASGSSGELYGRAQVHALRLAVGGPSEVQFDLMRPPRA